MIVDFRATDHATDLNPADAVVVVGSGPVGLALAQGLERAGRTVLLLESGGQAAGAPAQAGEELTGAADLQRGDVVGAPYAGLEAGRARGLGGSTQLWAGQCVRLRREDVAPRPWIGSAGWPLSFDELERWYPAAEEFLGVSGRGYGVERWAEHPDRERMAWDGDHLADDFTEITPRPRTGADRRASLRGALLVTLVEHATVTRVLHSGGRVRGVEVAAPDGRRATIAATEVVLAAGALENARLLMLSDPQGVGLGTGAAHTGRHLQDHVMITTVDLEPRRGIWLQDNYSPLHRRLRSAAGRRSGALWPKVRLAARAQRAHGLLGATAAVVHEHDQPYLCAAGRLREGLRTGDLGARTLADAARVAVAAAPLARAVTRRVLRGLGSGIPASRTSLSVLVEQSPTSASRVSLSEEVDGLGLRRARVDWHLGEGEIETSRRLTRWVLADLEREGVATARERDVMTDDDAWRAAARDAFHPSGTTRMSADPTDGVVDADGQVHGVTGLHVAGASTFPVAGYVNPTLTGVAMALRLADHLRPARRAASTPRWAAVAGVHQPA